MGVVSFANVTLFGVGAYGVSLSLSSVRTNWSALVIQFIAARRWLRRSALSRAGAADFLRHRDVGGRLRLQLFASRLSLPVIGEGGELALRPRLEG